MKINIITPTLLSPVDIYTMGGSDKVGDEEKIGMFNSGLKYAIALLLRNKVNIKITIHGSVNNDLYIYEFYTEEEQCDITGKKKELICFKINGSLNIGTSYKEIKTGFALQLGYNWELWQAWRELYSNMLDEKGYIEEEDTFTFDGHGTIITLEFDKDNPFYQVYQERDKYILNPSKYEVYLPLKDSSDNIKGYIFESPDGHLRIYKKGILVYENVNEKSFFNFNSEFGEIDERRMLNDYWSVISTLSGYLESTNDKLLMSFIIRDYDHLDKDDILNKISFYYPKKSIIDYYESVYEFGKPFTFKNLEESIKKSKFYNGEGKKLKSIEDQLWCYTKIVTLQSKPEEIVPYEEESIIAKIERKYDIKIECPIKVASIFGQKSIEDKFNKCIIIDENFDLEEDFAEFLVSYFSLVGKRNVLIDLAEFIKNKIKK